MFFSSGSMALNPCSTPYETTKQENALVASLFSYVRGFEGSVPQTIYTGDMRTYEQLSPLERARVGNTQLPSALLRRMLGKNDIRVPFDRLYGGVNYSSSEEPDTYTSTSSSYSSYTH